MANTGKELYPELRYQSTWCCFNPELAEAKLKELHSLLSDIRKSDTMTLGLVGRINWALVDVTCNTPSP